MRQILHKVDSKVSYTYESVTGEKFTVRVGENGVTEADITALRCLHNNEAYHNVKNIKPYLTEKEKQEIKEYEERHPGETYETQWALSLDKMADDHGPQYLDTLGIKSIWCKDEELDRKLDILDEAIKSLTPEQQKLVGMWLIGYSREEMAKTFGVNKWTISRRFTRAQKDIKKYFENFCD